MFHPSNKQLSCQSVDGLKGATFWGAVLAQKVQQSFLSSLFGCWHANSVGHSRICLSCGKEFAYVRVDFGRSFPKRKEEKARLDNHDVVGTDGEVTTDVGIWT